MEELSYIVTTESPEQTIALGHRIGEKLKGGEVIELISDLGGGKTTFVKGLASGLGAKGLVTSPSFTLTNEYTSDGLTLFHLDLYRLVEPGLLKNEIEELLQSKSSIIVIEWAEILRESLPDKRISIEVSVLDQDLRQFEFVCPKEFAHIIME